MTTPPTYPARPVNGGPLPKALPKSGRWIYEPKVNGWRALVHTPTGAMFNRRGARLTIEHEFEHVLFLLRQANMEPDVKMPEWLDCEAFERRHPLGRGSLVVLDAILPGTYLERQAVLHTALMDAQAELDGAFSPWPQEQFPPAAEHILWFSYDYEDRTSDGGTSSTSPQSIPDPDLLPCNAWTRLQNVNKQLKCELFEGLVAKRADSIYPMQLGSAETEFPFWVKHRWAF